MTNQDLLFEVNSACKKRTLQRLLRAMDKKKWLQKQRPLITEQQANARLAWARRHKAYTLQNWQRVVWSDECTIEKGKGVRPIYTFTRPRDQLRLRDVQMVRNTGKGVKKMLWVPLHVILEVVWFLLTEISRLREEELLLGLFDAFMKLFCLI